MAGDPLWPRVRDTVLFFGGLGGFLHELLSKAPTERPTILLASMAMMGLPFVARADEKRNGK